MTRRYLVVLAVLLIAGCGHVAAQAPAGAAPDRQALETKLKQLLGDRVESAKYARNAVQAAFDAETVTIDLLIWATEALCKAELAAATTPDERIAAHVKRVKNFALLFEKIASLWEVGARGGEAEKYAQAKYCLEDAQIGLAEECLASGRPYPDMQLPPHAAKPKSP